MSCKIIFFLLTLATLSSYQNIALAFNQTPLCRKQFINIITKSPALIPFICTKQATAQQSVENKPLTPAEMEEYNKLLKEAKRIQNIIDFNVNASKKILLQDGENGLEKYIRENNIKK